MMIKHALAAAALIAAMLLLGALADADARLKAAYEAGKREAACRPTT